jgi:hypothetical protein
MGKHLRSGGALSLLRGEKLCLAPEGVGVPEAPVARWGDYRDTGMHRAYDLALRFGVDPVRKLGQRFINPPPEGDAVCNRGRCGNRAEAGDMLVADLDQAALQPSCGSPLTHLAAHPCRRGSFDNLHRLRLFDRRGGEGAPLGWGRRHQNARWRHGDRGRRLRYQNARWRHRYRRLRNKDRPTRAVFNSFAAHDERT